MGNKSLCLRFQKSLFFFPRSMPQFFVWVVSVHAVKFIGIAGHLTSSLFSGSLAAGPHVQHTLSITAFGTGKEN